jgi:hypothetical protein
MISPASRFDITQYRLTICHYTEGAIYAIEIAYTEIKRRISIYHFYSDVSVIISSSSRPSS